MSDQPDKLFREKLYDYQKPVSIQAWSQLSANLDNKRRLVWWRSAAAIAVLCVAGVVMYQLREISPAEIAGPVVHLQDPAEPSHASQLPESKTQTDNEESGTSIASLTPQAETASPDEPKSTKKKPSPPALTDTRPTSEGLPAIPPLEPQPVALVAQPQTPATETAEQVDHSNRKKTTIVFTQAEVNEKYLLKTHRPNATSDDRETSRLKTMLDKAYDLTHNQDPIGDLRQKKNEILAMNFRKGKTDTQNE